MKKLNTKIKNLVNTIGAYCIRPRRQQGITLIALIITIIVMLILVGVTINVALNGGIFNKAETAAMQTQMEVDKETLQVAVIAGLNEELKIENAQAIQNNLQNGWNVTGTDGGPYTCTSPKENIFTVTEGGAIIIGEKANFYGVGYEIYGNYYYFFKNNIVYVVTAEHTYVAMKYSLEKNNIILGVGGNLALSEDYKTIITQERRRVDKR